MQLPAGSFREGVDIDIYFRNKAKVDSFSKTALQLVQDQYTKLGLDPTRLKLSKSQTHIKIVDKVTGLDVVDVGYRGG